MTLIGTSSETLFGSESERAGGCLPRTLIRMADGSERHIEEIRPSERVVTPDGRTGTVRHTITRRESESLIRLTLRGHTPVYLAAHHVVTTKNGDVAARDLMLDDCVALTCFLPAARATLDTSDVITPRERAMRGGAWQGGAVGEPIRPVTIVPIPDVIPLSPRMGRLVGLFLAYGSIDETKVRWTFAARERHALATQCADVLTDLGVRAELESQVNARMSVTVIGAAWARLWTRLFERRDSERALHPLLFGDGDYLRAMLAGWVAGEGYGGRNIADRWQRMRGSTISRTLAMMLCDIALGLGLRPTARLCAPKENLHRRRSKPFYEVDLVTPFEHPDNANQTDDGEENVPCVNPAYAWARVRGVEQYRFAGTVHSLDVDGEESYVAEGIGVRSATNRGAVVARAS